MRLPQSGSIEIAPSVLSADFGHLSEEIDLIASVGIKIVHLDIMDGHFVPNITIGPPVVASLRKHSDRVFDCHLMVTDPETYSERVAQAGADHITFHIEA
ncbi:MAG: ribulose-phosphate 3-epimerase, partial [Planctomycetota bacterium]